MVKGLRQSCQWLWCEMHDCLGEQEDATAGKRLLTRLIPARRQGMTWISLSAEDITVLRPESGESEYTDLLD